jgi:phosphoribosyl-ATP pyrophosphohydrolase
VVVAALGERGKLAAESADLLYHLLVLWAEAGLRPEEIWAELERRQGTSGLTEKASRSR